MLFVESDPWPRLTLIVSLEAIFLSTFVMIGQNRQAEFQRAKADHDFASEAQELRANTELTRAIHTLTTEIHRQVLAEQPLNEAFETGAHAMSETDTLPATEDREAAPDLDGWWQELNMLDVAGYAAIAATPTPELDRVLRRVSLAADHWKLWLGSAAALAIAGGPRGRRIRGQRRRRDGGHLGGRPPGPETPGRQAPS